jgi:hypothetical protein
MDLMRQSRCRTCTCMLMLGDIALIPHYHLELDLLSILDLPTALPHDFDQLRGKKQP